MGLKLFSVSSQIRDFDETLDSLQAQKVTTWLVISSILQACCCLKIRFFAN